MAASDSDYNSEEEEDQEELEELENGSIRPKDQVEELSDKEDLEEDFEDNERKGGNDSDTEDEEEEGKEIDDYDDVGDQQSPQTEMTTLTGISTCKKTNFTGGAKKENLLQYLKEQKKKALEAQKSDNLHTDHRFFYRDNIQKKLGVVTHYVRVKSKEELQQYYHSCLLSKYEIPRIVMYCKQYYQESGKKTFGQDLCVDRIWDDCNKDERIVHNIPVVLFKNYGDIQKEIVQFFR